MVAALTLGAVGLASALPSALAAGGPPVNTSLPTITGTTVVGKQLTSTVGGWTRKPTSFTRRWFDCDTNGLHCVVIPGATAAKYTLVSADVGFTIRVEVTATNSSGSATATSAPTGVVQAAATAPTNTSPPTINGTAQDGQILTASPGAWSGTTPISYAYQWQRCDTSGGNCANISGATATTYTVVSADVGHTLIIVVTASNAGGRASAPSSPTVIVQATPPTVKSDPTVSGTPQEGQTLTATTGTWSGTTPFTYTFLWEHCDPSGLDCSPISGATSSTYALTPADVGFTISVLVTATNTAGNSSAYSVATAVVQSVSAPAVNTAPPSISGTIQAGQQLTANPGTWTGAGTINYAYQWQGCDSNGANCIDIIGATASTYTPTSTDVGNTLDVVVTGSNADGQSAATSAPTATVQTAGTGGSTTIFSDGFESGNFSAWSPGATTAVGGSATVQSSIVRGGSYAAQLSESATSGSKAYLRESFAVQQDLTAAGDFEILQQGATGSNVLFFRFFDPSGTRLLQVYRQNGTSGAIWVSYGGAFYSTTGTLALNTWATVSAHVTTNGAASTVAVMLDGRQIYQTSTANLGTAGITTLQLGNDTAAQTFNLVADDVSVQTGSGSSGSPPANTSPPTISGTAQQGQTLTGTNGTWNGTAPISYAYQWQRCNSSGSNCANIALATAPTYTETSLDVGSTLRIAVTASNTAGSSTGFSTPTAVVAAPSPPPGIVAQWHMDEPSGSTMVDSAGSHDGVLHSVQLGVSGFSGTAYGFNGTSSYVDVASAPDLNPGSADITFTIDLQTSGTPPAAPGDWDLFRKGLYTTGGAEYKMELQQNGQVSCGFQGTGGYAELAAGPAVNDGQWHTVSCVKTSTAIQVVVDGQAFSKAANVGSISNTTDVIIGSRPGSDWYKGQLDEASIQIG